MAEKNIQMQRKNADGTFDLHYPITKVENVAGAAKDGDLIAHKADYVPHDIEAPGWIAAATTTLTRTDGALSRVDESVGGVLRRRTDLVRAGGVLSEVTVTVYAPNGTTISRRWKDTLNRSNGALQSVTRVVLV